MAFIIQNPTDNLEITPPAHSSGIPKLNGTFEPKSIYSLYQLYWELRNNGASPSQLSEWYKDIGNRTLVIETGDQKLFGQPIGLKSIWGHAIFTMVLSDRDGQYGTIVGHRDRFQPRLRRAQTIGMLAINIDSGKFRRMSDEETTSGFFGDFRAIYGIDRQPELEEGSFSVGDLSYFRDEGFKTDMAPILKDTAIPLVVASVWHKL